MERIPKVSIIIPAYNGAEYLREAIDSALKQTYANIEVLVINDGSNDGGKTEEIAKSYGNKIRYIPKPNGGVASALNTGIQEMAGEYVSWLSHDDTYYPEKITVQVAALKKNNGPVILYSDFDYVDSKGRFLEKKTVRRIEPRRFRLALLTGDPVNGCTTLIPRDCFSKVGLFNESLRSIQDYDMWFRLSKEYRFVHLAQSLLQSRVHAGQGINTMASHYDECQAFFIRGFSELSEEEISAMTGLSLPVFYARSAVIMKLRGFTGVAGHLLNLSEKHAAGAGLTDRMQQLALSVVCRGLNKKFKPTYWIKRFRNGSAA